MNYELKSTTGKLSATAFGEIHSTNEWYHIIRQISSGEAKQWKNVVVTFKALIAKGDLVKSTKASTGAVPKAAKSKAALANKVQNAPKQKAPSSAAKPVHYQVSDPNDTRQWRYIKEQFKTEAERDARIAEVKADPNMSFVSKGWGDRQFSVAYWKVVG
jgi:hypothetical protein